jgi:hypothetical protein
MIMTLVERIKAGDTVATFCESRRFSNKMSTRWRVQEFRRRESEFLPFAGRLFELFIDDSGESGQRIYDSRVL